MSKPNSQQGRVKSVPASALCFNVGVFELAEQPTAVKTDSGKPVHPVKLLGRTGKPIEHWYWGNVVHDMAGMKLHKDSVPIDYCHFADEVIGYLDTFDTARGELVASGGLVPFRDDDRASEIIYKSANKVPYEASINFGGGPMRLEEIDAGTSATVNGSVVNGPALIIREWTLRGIAICPYGADMNTKTELSAGAGDKGRAADALVEVTLFKAGEMPGTQTEAKPNDTTKPTELANTGKPAEPTADAGGKPTELAGGTAKPTEQKPAAKPGAEFVAAFGDKGARWFLEGRTFSDCAAEHIADQAKQIAELTAKNGELSKKLGDVQIGNDPVTFKATDKGTGKTLPKGVTGGAAAAFAAARPETPAEPK